MSTYLVTGAAGFIGGAVAKRLLNEGHEIVTIDNLSTGFEKAIPKGVKFYKGNCQDYSTVKQLEQYSFDAIFHIAGQSSGEISFEDPVYDLQTNAQSTLLLLKLALKTKCKKFIYASTMSVYGDKPDEPVNEDSNLSPKSFYGVGKVASEQYMRLYQNYGISSTALRLFNVYGPGQNMLNLKQGMVSIFLAQAIENKKIIIKGSDDRFRDFIYIDDVVDSFIRALSLQSTQYKYFNVCTGIRTTIKKLINELQQNIPFNISIEFDKTTPGDQFGVFGDNTKIVGELGWSPKINLAQGLKLMTLWIQRVSAN